MAKKSGEDRSEELRQWKSFLQDIHSIQSKVNAQLDKVYSQELAIKMVMGDIQKSSQTDLSFRMKVIDELDKQASFQGKLLVLDKLREQAQKKYSGHNKAIGQDLVSQLNKVEILLKHENARERLSEKMEPLLESQLGFISKIEEVLGHLPGGDFLVKAMGFDNLEKRIKKDMEANIEKAAMKGSKGFSGMFKIMMTGLKTFATALLANPLFLVAGLIALAIHEFMEFNKEANEFQETTGLASETSKELVKQYKHLGPHVTKFGATMKDTVAAGTALVEQFGSLNQINDEMVENVVKMNKLFGVTLEDAAGTSQILQNIGASVEDANKIQIFTAALAKAGQVAPGKVMKDIANNAEVASKFFSGNPKALAKAAVEAARLGMSLKDMSSTMDKIMDIEGSLEDEMTAQVMLGQQINFDTARQLALQGKLDDAMKNMLDQAGGISKFNEMDFMQRESIAKAMGLSVDQLSKSLTKQTALGKLTASQKDEYSKYLDMMELSGEESADEITRKAEQAKHQESLTASFSEMISQMKEALLPIGQAFFAIMKPIGDIFGSMGGAVGKIIIGLVATIAVTSKLIAAWRALRGLQIASAIASIFSGQAALPIVGLAIAGAAVAGMMAMIGSSSARAKGGPVSAGKPYMVGELGPELIVPGESGNVIPNNKLSTGGGGGSGNTMVVDLNPLIKKIDELIGIVHQPVIIKMGDKVVSEMDSRLSLRKNMTTGFDNSYGSTLNNRS